MSILDSDILKMKFDQPEPEAGDLLIAEPLMSDGTFRRSVVILIEHSENAGSMGFITNHYSGYDLNDLVEEVITDEEIPIYIGGPVHHDRLYYIHTLGDIIPDSINIGNELFLSGNFEAIIEYINSGATVNGKIKFFLGYSGWEKSQLKAELKNYDWAVSKHTNAERILTLDEEEAWRCEVTQLDDKYRLWLNCPVSVALN